MINLNAQKQSNSAPTVLIDKKMGAVLTLEKEVRGFKNFSSWSINSNTENNDNPGIEFITFSDFYSSLTF